MSQTKAQLISDLVQALAFTATASAPTNGMFLSATNELAISTNSSTRLTVDSSGNIGIGVTNPAHQLELGNGDSTIRLNATAGGNAALKFLTNTGNVGQIVFGDTADDDIGYIQYAHTDNSLKFAVNASERMRIDSSGNVGIGDTNPGEKLDVNGKIRSDHSSDSRFLLRVNNVNKGGFSATTDAGVVIYGASSTNPIRFQTSGSEKARIDTSGRLLVGNSSARANFYNSTNSPYIQLEGNDNNESALAIIQDFNAGTQGAQLVLAKNNSQTIGSNVLIDDGDQCGTVSFQGNDGTQFVEAASIIATIDGTPGANDMPGRLTFLTTADGDAGPTERMRINSVGNVKLTGGEALFWDDAGDRYIACIGDTNSNINLHGRANVIFKTGGSSYDGGTERMRIDSSGRLLVGTSTNLGLGVVQIPDTCIYRQGNASSTGQNVGVLKFGDTRPGEYAQIRAEADATPGSNDFPGRLLFSTTGDGGSSPTERMRIASNGQLLLNCTGLSGDGPNQKGARIFQTNGNCKVKGEADSSSDTDTMFQFYHGTQTNPNGTITITNTVTNYNETSDYRLKENVVDITDGITRVKQLQPKRFNFIVDADTTIDGFLAHEAQTVVPEAVTGTHNEVDDDGNPVMQQIDKSKLVPLLTAALQEAIAKIETLETKVAALEAE